MSDKATLKQLADKVAIEIKQGLIPTDAINKVCDDLGISTSSMLYRYLVSRFESSENTVDLFVDNSDTNEMSDEEIKEWFSRKILKIQDKGLETALRRILFNKNNKIDWQDVKAQINYQMPETLNPSDAKNESLKEDKSTNTFPNMIRVELYPRIHRWVTYEKVYEHEGGGCYYNAIDDDDVITSTYISLYPDGHLTYLWNGVEHPLNHPWEVVKLSKPNRISERYRRRNR